MKQFIVIICLAVALASCNDATTTGTGTDTAGAVLKTAGAANLPFPLKKPYKNWQTGSTENIAAAMNALKAFVDNDFKALAAAIGDSVELHFDYYGATLSRDSAINMFTAQRAQYNDLTITMWDCVSVISADKSEEWVTMWYKQRWKNNKGVADSLFVNDDCKMKNGKMIQLDEMTSHFPAKR
jgi:hypothetical protein